MVKPLGTLFSESWSFFQKHFVVLLVGAIVFGVINGYVGQSMAYHGQKFGRNMMEQMGAGNMFTEEKMKKMEDLSMKAMQGDMDAAAELEAMGTEMEAAAGQMEDAMKDMDISASMVGKFAGMLGTAMLLSFLISAIAGAYFLSVSVFSIASVGAAVNKTIATVLPVLGLWIWLVIRTFVWIPFIGIITGIILGPRFIVAPINLLEGGKGVFESATISYSQTAGMWAKIFGNMLAIGLLLWIVFMVLGMALSMASTAGNWIMAVVTQLGSAFMIVFGVHLARTVMAK